MLWEPVILALALLGGTSFSVWGVASDHRARVKKWREIASWSELRVVDSTTRWTKRPSLKVKSGPLAVRIEQAPRQYHMILLGIAVPGPPGFNEVRIRRERHRPRGVREIELGDKPFDSKFFVEGPPRLVLALFDEEMRRLLIGAEEESLYSGALEIVDGEIRAETSDVMLPELLPILLEVGRQLAQPIDIVRRLAENATQDPAAGVRLQNLRLLARQFPGEPGTVETLRAALADASPEVRLWAAKELGAEGRDILIALAESTAGDDLTAQAVSILGPALPFERAADILGQALRRRRLQTARACLESLGRGGDSEAVDLLMKVLAREKGELAVVAARALGEAGSPAAEPALLLALQREKVDLQVAAASALGRAGSVESVPALKDAAERFSHLPELRRATRQAIAEIQARLPGASPGQLSLAGEEAGQLSLAEAEAGQLSLSTDPGGQLSLNESE